MKSADKTYIAIDLKSFYASVECVERGLDPMTAKLVVADESRTDKTICLAVTPPLKKYGIPGRPRLFEVKQKVREDFIIAVPRMALYIEYSMKIYEIYLKYFAPEDLHVYSIDEIFIDASTYLSMYRLSPYELTLAIIKDVKKTTGITATAGIGTNLYLAKVAMDIVAKKISADEDGARIACLDEMSYREQLWNHQPITDFWRVGSGYAKRLKAVSLHTMGDIARCSIGGPEDYYNEDLLYYMFGINAQLLIDHAWGHEPCRMSDIKEYKPTSNSMSSGQVLQRPYTYREVRTVVMEMVDSLVLDLVDKELVCRQMVLHIGYDKESLENPLLRKKYAGPIKTNYYGREVPKHAHGTANLNQHTSSTRLISEAVMELFERIVDKNLLARRVSITATHVLKKSTLKEQGSYEQLSLFTDELTSETKKLKDEVPSERERKEQEAILSIRRRYGKNAILKGLNFSEGATGRERNNQIGGHEA